MNAGKSVLEDIVESFAKGNPEVMLKKYVKRYPHDLQLQNAYRRFCEVKESDGDTKTVEKRLKNLLKTRQLEASGGHDLALKDRRRFKKS